MKSQKTRCLETTTEGVITQAICKAFGAGWGGISGAQGPGFGNFGGGERAEEGKNGDSQRRGAARRGPGNAGMGNNGDKSGFHGVEVLEKVGSMPWKTGTIWVPWRGKTANLTSMAWNFLHCNKKRRLPLRGAGGVRGGDDFARGGRAVRAVKSEKRKVKRGG
jgi:hypothetical protein